MKLIRIDRRIKYSFYNLNSICGDDNIYNILHLSCLTNTIFNGKNFSFDWWHIYLILILDIISIVFWLIIEFLEILSSLLPFVVSVLISFLLTEWKEKQLEKVFTRWKPEESFLFKLLKARKNLFKQLFVFIMELLVFKHCLEVRKNITMSREVAFLE